MSLPLADKEEQDGEKNISELKIDRALWFPTYKMLYGPGFKILIVN